MSNRMTVEHHGPESWLTKLPFLSKDPHYVHINGSVLVFLFLTLVSVLAYLGLKKRRSTSLVPSSSVSLVTLIDLIVESLYDMICDVLGDHGKDYFNFIATIFVFVFFNNLLGLLPLGSAPTAVVSTTVALGLACFVYYNWMGIKAHGFTGYLKHFLMGLGPFGVVVALLEMVSHIVRPFSLGIRLFVNMFVDHSVVLAFMDLFMWLVPVPLLLFGLVVCTIQAFVFAVLTAVYVQMAIAHD